MVGNSPREEGKNQKIKIHIRETKRRRLQKKKAKKKRIK